MRVRRAFFLLMGPLVISACALVADLGERTLGDPNAIGTGDASKDDASKTKNDASKTDAEPPTPDPPTFCDGIIVYASFDGKLKGDKGGDTTFSSGAVSSSTQGKFGGALSLVGQNAELSSPGAAHWLLASGAGNPWPETKGSFAVWFRSAPAGNPPVVPVLYRPVATQPTSPTLDTAGLAFYLHRDVTDQTGLYERSGGDPVADKVLTFGIDEVAPFLRTTDYNHYFTAWDQNGGTKAFMAINGGLGVTFNGTETGVFPDGGAPFRATTSREWISEGEPVGVRLGGVGRNSPQGLYDDLVIWNRVVSFEEVSALYSSGKPVGDICQLR
jgi:hypothetical protein